MYCPSCGSEERQPSQYCRACGTDLRVVRRGLERPDTITASAVSAREQISQALADKIRQMESAKDLERVAEDVLPQLEKFLESPEEKRLRRVRAGVITALVGLGVSLVILNRTSRRESIRLRLYERFNLRREIANVPEWSFAIIEIRAVVVSGAIKLLHPAGFHSQFIQCGDGSQPFCFRDAS